MEKRIRQIVQDKMDELDRGDLYRDPIIGFSSAQDSQYEELKEIIGPWHKNPDEIFDQARTVISIYVPFSKDLSRAAKRGLVSVKWAEGYKVINDYFSEISQVLADYLQTLGYVSQELPATHNYSQEDLRSVWSHRSAGKISGIGDFMANRIFMTKKGCAGRLTSLFTSAVIEPSPCQVESKCLYKKDGSCGLCFKACPVGALKADSFDRFACNRELMRNLKNLEENTGLEGADVCGKCISVCPYAYIA